MKNLFLATFVAAIVALGFGGNAKAQFFVHSGHTTVALGQGTICNGLAAITGGSCSPGYGYPPQYPYRPMFYGAPPPVAVVVPRPYYGNEYAGYAPPPPMSPLPPLCPPEYPVLRTLPNGVQGCYMY